MSGITNLDRFFLKQGKAPCWQVDEEVDDGKGLSEKVDEEMDQEVVKMAPPPTEMLVWRSSNQWQGISHHTHSTIGFDGHIFYLCVFVCICSFVSVFVYIFIFHPSSVSGWEAPGPPT